jgi:hypothetical protein
MLCVMALERKLEPRYLDPATIFRKEEQASAFDRSTLFVLSHAPQFPRRSELLDSRRYGWAHHLDTLDSQVKVILAVVIINSHGRASDEIDKIR